MLCHVDVVIYVETIAFEKETSAQNCADVLTRALAPSVFRQLLNDHVLVGFNFATARPTRIRQCRTAAWSVGGGANNGEDDNDGGDRHEAWCWSVDE